PRPGRPERPVGSERASSPGPRQLLWSRRELHGGSAGGSLMTRARPGAPRLKGCTVQIPVRFAQCDRYGFGWHGHYALYLEQAREALTARFGFTASTALALGYRVPITRMEIRYHLPILADTVVAVTARLRPTEIARLQTDYEIRSES